uniref:Uncharacterized protein n=1 Tax=viral metagenome TaxID=1070528 RepID=A0A6M3J8S5_9ZZZZ
MKRKISITDILGIGPYVVEDAIEIIATPRSAKNAQEIANIPCMIEAINEAINYLSENTSVLKLNREDLLDMLNDALTYQEI